MCWKTDCAESFFFALTNNTLTNTKQKETKRNDGARQANRRQSSQKHFSGCLTIISLGYDHTDLFNTSK
jgi:hypothetical protein